jgi:tryptophan halogenase
MNIVVVGGGTAGWLAAYYILKSQPNKHKVTVIESSAIGIIGAGEGSTQSLIHILEGSFFNYKIDISDFIDKTDGFLKMGIKHTGWNINKESYFAPLDYSPSGFTLNDYIFKYVFSKEGKEGMHKASTIGIEYSKQKINNAYALHFDGHKVGKYFKDLCVKDGAKVIDSVVTDVVLDKDSNVKTLVLEDGLSIDSDLFIDCTGFARVLMKKLEVNWVSKKEFLPVNTAMPFILPYKKGEFIYPETGATALSSGWMWNIPLKTRRGCGYVFDGSYITKEEAKQEIEDFIKQKIEPIKYIHFDSGYSEYFLKNNVLCLGLSSSFVEPLEATSIHNTIIQISMFVEECLTPDKESTFTQSNQDMYNKRIKTLMDLTVDFISLHYQGGRTDTPFWRNISENKIGTPWALETVKRAKEKIPGYTSLEGTYGSFSMPLANWILAGLDIITPDQAAKELIYSKDISFVENQYQDFYNSIT